MSSATLINDPHVETTTAALTADERQNMHAYWRACNYLCAA